MTDASLGNTGSVDKDKNEGASELTAGSAGEAAYNLRSSSELLKVADSSQQGKGGGAPPQTKMQIIYEHILGELYYVFEHLDKLRKEVDEKQKTDRAEWYSQQSRDLDDQYQSVMMIYKNAFRLFEKINKETEVTTSELNEKLTAMVAKIEEFEKKFIKENDKYLALMGETADSILEQMRSVSGQRSAQYEVQLEKRHERVLMNVSSKTVDKLNEALSKSISRQSQRDISQRKYNIIAFFSVGFLGSIVGAAIMLLFVG